MSKIQAIIYTSTNGENDLIFNNEDIIAISTNTKCIENETMPEFDIFPNSGTLTVKDKNLVIYNKSIQGLFDNYEYKVEYLLDDKIIATHIINARPSYNYEAKTCTFYLGNSLDSLANQTFEPYAYPLESQTLYTIFQEVLKRIFNIDETYYQTLMSGVFGDYKVGETTYDKLTFAAYFNAIYINYPYISETNSREALKTILLISQCGLYLDKNNKLKLIRLDGYSNASYEDYYNNVYKIESKHMNKGFVPSVILDNKFNQININAYKDELKTLYGEQIYDQTIQAPTLYPKTEINYNDYLVFNSGVLLHGAAGDWKSVAISCQKPLLFGFATCIIFIPKYQNFNLLNVLEIFTSKKNTEENPTISILAEKTTTIYKGTVNATLDEVVSYSKETQTSTQKEEIYLPLHEFTNFNTWNFTYYYGNDAKTATANSDLKINIDYSIEQTKENKRFMLKIYDILSYIKYDIINTGARLSSGGTKIENADGTITEIEIRAKALTFRVRGDVQTITFESLLQEQKKTNENNYYKTNLQNTKELAHRSSYFKNTSNKILDCLGNNLLNTFNGGLNSGTVTTIASDYNTYLPTDESNIGKNKDRMIFEVGDKVMPYKNGSGIIKRKNETYGTFDDVVFQVVDVETYNEGGATSQNLVLREIKRPPQQ